MGEAAVATQREPAEEVGEYIEQEKPDDELRRRDAGERQHHGRLVGRGAAPRGGEDARRDADEKLGEDGRQHELQGGGKPRGDEIADGGLARVGMAEVAPGEPRHIGQVLDGQRLVEAELLADELARLGGGVAAGEHRRRVGGNEIGEAERDKRHADENDERGAEAAEKIGDRHARRPRWVGSSASLSPSPTRLKASATTRMAMPGKNTIHGAFRK